VAGGALIPFSARVWRLVLPGQDPFAPVRAPEGRFHHSGQWAIYTSLTPEGCHVAVARYGTDVPRDLVALEVTLAACADERGNPAASVVWQDGPRPALPWRFSDAARAAGAEGMLYSSRSRSELTHLVLFAPSALRPAQPPVGDPF
jgi:RES domain-containing protein